MDTELERFKIEVVLPEFAAARGYFLDRRASSRNSVVMRHPDGDKIIIARYEGTTHWGQDTKRNFTYAKRPNPLQHL